MSSVLVGPPETARGLSAGSTARRPGARRGVDWPRYLSWLSACSSGPPSPCSWCSTRLPHRRAPPRRPGPDHSETSVRQAAQLMLDAYTSGSYGDFWDMWSTGAQGLIAREEYVRLFQLCPPRAPGTSFTITEVAITGDNANVQAARFGEHAAFDFLFESGSWRSVPSPDLRREYQTSGRPDGPGTAGRGSLRRGCGHPAPHLAAPPRRPRRPPPHRPPRPPLRRPLRLPPCSRGDPPGSEASGTFEAKARSRCAQTRYTEKERRRRCNL